jgi:hypothetical protein
MSDDELSGTIVTALRRANPVPVEQVDGRRSLPSAHALFAEIVSQPPRRVRPRRVVAFAVVVALIAATFAAFAAVNRDDATTGTSTVCYAERNLKSEHEVAGFGDPVQVCTQLWHDGAFGDRPVPKEFDACVLSTGAPAVFPGEAGSVCSTLGLANLRVSSLEARIQAFTAETGPLVKPEGGCIDDAAAQAIVRRKLQKFGLDDWTIAHYPDQPYTDEFPCASMAVVPESRQVFLVPFPRP